ncbi:hypothetical protein [Klebsiella quasipneumoniae]|uniref:hypothetical protein n=1 Tax=Klebsiella quasipneumoniae TaxID=1463165 RepID=UPI002949F977|nr:hypothetical protein [Klebsiella quasipneumoniae]MDV5432731.1 hypothetical protein [Klebsiella quasipneumoniae]
MKELTVFEMEEISAGADIFGNIGAAALGAVVGAVWGTLIGGTQSGANGGLLGFGRTLSALSGALSPVVYPAASALIRPSSGCSGL